MPRLIAVLLALCAGTLPLSRPAAAAEPPKPADNQPAAAPKPGDAKPGDVKPADDKKEQERAQRSQQVQAELQKTGQGLRDVITSPDILWDQAKRQDATPKVVPPLKKMSALLLELATLEPDQAPAIGHARTEFLTILTTLGDADAAAELKKTAAGKGHDAIDARLALHSADYWKAGKDEKAQLKVVEDIQKLAKENADSDEVAQGVMKLTQMGPASAAVSEKLEAIVATDLKGELAQQMAAQIKGEKKMKEAVGKPVELTGTTLDGKPFTTKDWKGKVILVDFWATWCGPCLRELPKVKKAYITHHAKGLEILGVSCDQSIEDLKGFLEQNQNKDMPWPQLFDAKENPKQRWHPLAKEWGINGIPTMFLIDRKGVLRSVEARSEFEEMIPKLLEEKADEPAKAPAK